MFVPVTLNGKEVSALVDTWATYIFISTKGSDQLGLKSRVSTSKINVVNSPAKQIQGLAKGVQICLGEFNERANFMIMEINDFEVILSNNFFVSAYIGVLPYLEGMMVMYQGNGYFIWGHSKLIGVGDPKTDEE